MRKMFLVGMSVLATATLGGAAQAADLPAKAPPPVAPAFSWTGFYIGAHVGAAWGTVESEIPLGGGGAVLPISSHTINGVIGGGQIGWNWQVNPWLVLGVEGQFSGSGVEGSTPCVLVFKCTTEVNWIATLAGRVGYTYDRTMLYVKGGVAWADSDYLADFLGAGVATFSASDTRSGFMLGAGIEHAFWSNWSAKLEYNYLDFGTDSLDFAFDRSCVVSETAAVVNQCGGSRSIPVDVTQKIHLIKFGLNYRFNWGSPAVAARY